MLDEQRIYEYGGLLAAGYGLYQAKQIHDTELEKAKQRHIESIELAKKQHEVDMKTVKQTYLLELFNSLEQHFQQLNADLIASSRESERDMFDQRNQSFQTIILASSVMFSALSSIIVDGNLPLNTGEFLLVAYSLTCSLSFSFLFLSIVFCIELVIRTSSFMYKRGKSHTKSLRSAINDTKGMMRDLRGEGKKDKENSDVSLEASGLNASANQINGDKSTNYPCESIKESLSTNSMEENGQVKAFRRAISRMGPNEIEAEFDRHESEIRSYLRKRELLNDSAAITSYTDAKTGHKKPFKHFWEESCETWWSLAVLLFYGGSLNMLLALMIYMWAQFLLFYNSLVAAIIGVSVLGLISIIGIGTVILMRHVDRTTHRVEMAMLRQANQSDDHSNSTRTEDDAHTRDESRIGVRSRWSSSPFTGRSQRTARSDSHTSQTYNDVPGITNNTNSNSNSNSNLTPATNRTVARFRTASPNANISPRSMRTSGAGEQSPSTQSTQSNTVSERSLRGSSVFRTQSQAPHLYPHQHQQQNQQQSQQQNQYPHSHQTPQLFSRQLSPRTRLETHPEDLDDLENGSVLRETHSDCSTNSALSIPPRLRSGGLGGQHLYQEEPPRRRFLSSFGRSGSTAEKNKNGGGGSGSGGGTPSSLYQSALCRTPARSEAGGSVLATPLRLTSPSGGVDYIDTTPSQTVAAGQEQVPVQHLHSFRFPRALPPSRSADKDKDKDKETGNKQDGCLQSGGAGADFEHSHDSTSDFSSSGGGGITF